VIGPDGRIWWTVNQAVDQLGIRRGRLGDWVRRSKAAGHVDRAEPADCPACGAGGFPHVDRPILSGRAGVYPAEQLLEAESHTAGSLRGGASRLVT
jgi:hypothetical protein